MSEPQTASDDSLQVDVLVHFDSVTLNEVRAGQPTPLVADVELAVVALVPTTPLVDAAKKGLHLPDYALEVGNGTPLVFLLIRDYKIPLNKATLVLQAGVLEYTFVLPNHLFMQVVITPTADTTSEDFETMEDVMSSYGNLKKKPQPVNQPNKSTALVPAPASDASDKPRPPVSTRIAIGLGKVTRVAVSGIHKGAELVSSGVKKGSHKIVEKTEACKEPVVVSDTTKAHIQRARTASKGVALLSSTVATSMVGVATVMGNFIGSRAANRIGSDSSPKLEAVKEVGGALIGCAGLIFEAASEGGLAILTSSCEGISHVVTHKFGEEVGSATSESLGVVSDVASISHNMKKIGVRGVMAATAQSSASTMLTKLEEKHGGAPAK